MGIDLDAMIQAAKDELGKPQTEQLSVVVAGDVLVLQFTKLQPFEWRDLVALFPPRAGVTRDVNLGFNHDRFASGFPVSHVKVVDGDNVVDVSVEQWKQLFEVLESPDIFNIATTLWGMHEYAPAQRLVEAKKALKKKKSGSSRKG